MGCDREQGQCFGARRARAKSGDDLMRWQSIARGERRLLQAENVPCRSTERVGYPSVSIRLYELVK